VIHNEPEPPSRLRPEVPAELEAVCLKSLEKAPADRYASAQELADDLGRWLGGEPPLAAPVSEWERPARWAREAGFEVEDVLTFGVRDIVYRARQAHLNRPVALKVVVDTGAQDDEASRERLGHEAKEAALLDHPNIVRIYSSGEHGSRAYIAFEYIAGGSLIERYVDRPVAPPEAARLVWKLAQAMHYAHGKGVLHCALKPSNILLTPEGQPKITSFGLSRLLRESRSGRPVAFRRLPSYMAPELAEGRAADVGPATDVYALGAILYKLLTGDPPFLGETLDQTLAQVRAQPPRPPRSLRPEVPAALEAVCLRCLEKDPAKRYPSAEELAGALADSLAAGAVPIEQIPGYAVLREPGPGKPAAKPAAEPADAPTIPGYKVLRELGRGSLSVVYEARYHGYDRMVALKVWRPEFSYGPELRSRLREVAERVARLLHPNVVAVYDYGEKDERPYCSMDLLPGGNLAEKLAGRLVPPPEAAGLTRTLARAMDYVHQEGIVHGNLKPSKILFNAAGTPLVTGFIVAHGRPAERMGDTFPTRMEPAVMGTPRYMAPEQVSGEGSPVGPATDVYALGLVLYELLTGNTPFTAPTLWEMLAEIMRTPPGPPSQVRPRVPPELDAVCLRCLEKEPARRYPSAGALADDLDHFLAGRPLSPVSGRRPGAWARLVDWVRGRPPAGQARRAGPPGG
jgi:serine/threonine protein kinase